MGCRERKFMPSAITVLTAMVFWGQIQNYMMRVNISILIVAMVKSPGSGSSSANNSTILQEDSCLVYNKFNNDSSLSTTTSHDEISAAAAAADAVAAAATAAAANPENAGSFEWDEFQRGLVLSAFGYGYILTQIIGGRLAERFGPKLIYGLGLFVTGILSLLSPMVAHMGVSAFIALRVLQGIFEGVSFPSLHALTARWVPVGQRNSFIARSYLGTNFGLIITFPMCGLLVSNFGWESAFYVIGSITSAWFVFWWLLVFDHPDQHPRIDPEEREELNNALLLENLDNSSSSSSSSKSLAVPWVAIFTSLPFIGLMCSDASNTWGFNTLASNGPSYLKYMLGVDIKTNGFLSGLPMLCRYLGAVILAKIADFLYTRRYLSLTNTRKVFNFISEAFPALTMIALSFGGCDVSLAIALLCIGFFFNGAIASGHLVRCRSITG